MENKYLDKIADAFNVDSPEASNMDAYLDILIPIVRQYSEDLREERFYLDKAWLEIRDDVGFHKDILHFFHEDQEYLRSVNGDVDSGSWRFLERSNKFIIDINGNTELYDLAFLDDHFFILDKHGDQQKLGKDKYFVMVHERVGKNLEWREAMEYLFNKYKNTSNFFIIVALVVLLTVAIFMILSLG